MGIFSSILRRTTVFTNLVDVIQNTILDVSKFAESVGRDIREIKMRVGLVERRTKRIVTRKRLHSLRMYERRNLNRLFR